MVSDEIHQSYWQGNCYMTQYSQHVTVQIKEDEQPSITYSRSLITDDTKTRTQYFEKRKKSVEYFKVLKDSAFYPNTKL